MKEMQVQPSRVPDIPGRLLQPDRSEEERVHLIHLRDHVARLCGLDHQRFPGAQPVSFERKSLALLESEDYWVCEKSDGQRVLILILVNPRTHIQEVYLIDRRNDYRLVSNLVFPHHERDEFRTHTLLDGELVLDRDPSTGIYKLRLLLFDCVVLDRESMASRPLTKRYGRLLSHVHPPYLKCLQTRGSSLGEQPFEVLVKDMDLAYSLEYVLHHRMRNLQHPSDGLIFTCLNSGYVMGTDEKILKWKPPSENTIDFKLRLKFPPDLTADPTGRLPDLTAKPLFLLDQFMGGSSRYEYFDWMWMDDNEWAEHRAAGTDLDGKIVECYWDAGTTHLKPGESDADIIPPRWRFHRVRDDKQDGNHSSVVTKILKSIQDGVERDELLAAAPALRAAWKSPAREAFRKGDEERNPHKIHFGGGPGPPLRQAANAATIRRYAPR